MNTFPDRGGLFLIQMTGVLLLVMILPSCAFLPSSTWVQRNHVDFDLAPRSAPCGYYDKVPTARTTTTLRVVADFPVEKEGEKKEKKHVSDWTPSKNGGFIPNLRARFLRSRKREAQEEVVATPPPSSSPPQRQRQHRLVQIEDIYQYKDEVADVKDQMVCVRFYAPWCKSCKAVEAPFRRLQTEFPDVKFVEVPVTKENTYLHQGLGIPSLPFGHLYHPEVGLVEERGINRNAKKNDFGLFKKTIDTYVKGECPVSYSDADDGSENFMS